MPTSIQKIAVIGAGVIGSSWTALFLSHGFEVLVADPAEGAEQQLRQYMDYIWESLPKFEVSNKDAWRFCGPEISAEDLSTVDFVQENSPERLQLKIDLLAKIDQATRPNVPICSSTSGLVPSSFIALCKKAPERVLVAHPWNPPHLIPLVELVPHPGTNTTILEMARKFYMRIGKKPIVLHREAPGFVGNRLQAAVSREAFNLVAEGICEPEDVERAMLDALGPRWALTGPFMTSSLGAGGNPGGYERMSRHLGGAMKEFIADMEQVGQRIEQDRPKYAGIVVEKVEKGIGQVDTRKLQLERNEVLTKILKLRSETEVLDTYADKISS